MSKYKKTGGSGIVYDTMEDAHEDYCIGRRCEDCPLDLPSKMANEPCNVWVKGEPEQAAEMMGLEIIPAKPETEAEGDVLEGPEFYRAGHRISGKALAHCRICWELNELYERKNHDYGDSFHQSFQEEGMAMARIRLGDKLSRFKTLTRNGGQQVEDESIRDTLIDLANYAIMTVMEMDNDNAATG